MLTKKKHNHTKHKKGKKYKRRTLRQKYKRKTLPKKYKHTKNKLKKKLYKYLTGGQSTELYMEKVNYFMESLKEPNNLDKVDLKTTNRVISFSNNNMDTNMELLFKNSFPFLTEDTINNDIIIIRGGRSRVPDIIIDKHDFQRAINYLVTNLQLNTTTSEYIKKIVEFVRIMLHTDDVVKFELVNEMPILDTAWQATVDYASACIKKNTTELTNKLTNMTALPYIIGDCREHGLLSSFLCNVYQDYICKQSNTDCNNIFRAIYTTSYKVNDDDQTIEKIEDHVFCLMLNKVKKTIWVIDPLYSDNTSSNRMTFNNTQATFINKDDYKNYKVVGKERDISKYQTSLDEGKPILWCGNIYINDKHKFKVINIPKLWDGSIEVIEKEDNDQFQQLSNDNLLLYNRIFKYDEYLISWKKHKDWCPHVGV